MSSLTSLSNIGVSSTKSDKPLEEKSRPIDGSEQSFGDLFGRVFGQSSVRQGLAAEDGQDQKPSLRAVFIGSETQVITAGHPPTEEEILSFAREANLDETSVQALLLTIPGNPTFGLMPIDSHNSATGQTPAAGGLGGELNLDKVLLESRQGASGSALQTAAGALGQATQQSVQSTAQPAANALAGQGPSGPPGSLGTFNVSVNSFGMDSEGNEKSALEVLSSRAELEGEGVNEEFLAGRLGLSPKDFAKKQLFESLAARVGTNDMLMRSSPAAQLEPIDLSESDFNDLDPSKDSTAEGSDEPPSLSSGLHASLDMGGRSSSGSGEGSSGRPDQLAQQPGRALSQQVLQRFGELLGQRLLQQIGQGNWKVEMALEPAELGSIQIELEWRKGELEASFKAPQATTRELLQEGLPRLREVLERAGIDVASVYVGDQGRQQSFHDRSGRGLSQDGSQSRQPDPVNELEADKTGLKIRQRDDGRLDVLV
jgi:hypothetical protein